jgi:hypothetical protein
VIKLTDALDAADPIPQPQKTEPVEVWTFVFKNGDSAVYPIRTDRNEQALMVSNPNDKTLVEIRLVFRDDVTNEPMSSISFIVANLQSWALDKATMPVYAPGEDPVAQELKRIAGVRAQRAAAWEKIAKAREEEFARELADAEK